MWGWKLLLIIVVEVMDLIYMYQYGVHWPSVMLVGTWLVMVELLNKWDAVRGQRHMRFWDMPNVEELREAAETLIEALDRRLHDTDHGTDSHDSSTTGPQVPRPEGLGDPLLGVDAARKLVY